MLNILSYVGMSLQSELCLWTMLGLCRTIFDATLFKVNANLKQVWQMGMPAELTMPVQRVLRTMISGVMLVQCFTVYVYLASYIVLLYPIFLEERPTLVLPWLLLAAIRKFLCEFTSLALGLGTCVLLGPARPPCIKFVVIKIATITPAFYMWMLVFSYYHTLKVSSAYKTFAAVLPSNDLDDGLELAVRRRRTKSLFCEDELRKKLVSTFNYGARQSIDTPYLKPNISSRMVHSTDTNREDLKARFDNLPPTCVNSERILSDTGSYYYEDWCGNEVIVPRDTDRILEQFVLMLLRVSAYLQAEAGTDPAKLFSSHLRGARFDSIECTAPGVYTDTPPQVGNSKRRTSSYLQEYPHIFMKRTDTLQFQDLNGSHNQVENDDLVGVIKSQSHTQCTVLKTSSETTDRRKIIDKEMPIIESSSNFIFPIRSKKSSPGDESSLKEDKNTGYKNKMQTHNELPEIYSKLSSEDSLKLSILEHLQAIQVSHSKDSKVKDNNTEKVESDTSEAGSVASLDSLQCIIDRMKKSLSQSKKSHKTLEEQNKKEKGT